MPKGQWNDKTPGKRRAAAQKSAAARVRRAKRGAATEAEQLRAYLHEGGPPLAAPERGGAEDRVLRGEQLSELLARLRSRQVRDVAA